MEIRISVSYTRYYMRSVWIYSQHTGFYLPSNFREEIFKRLHHYNSSPGDYSATECVASKGLFVMDDTIVWMAGEV